MGGGAKQRNIPETRSNSISSNSLRETFPGALNKTTLAISSNRSFGDTSRDPSDTVNTDSSGQSKSDSKNDSPENFNNPSSTSKSFFNSSDLDISNTPSSHATFDAVPKDEDQIDTSEDAPIPALDTKPHKPRGRSPKSSSTATSSDISYNTNTSSSSSGVSSKSTSNKSSSRFSHGRSSNSPSSSSGFFSNSAASASRSSSNASSSVSSVFRQLDQEKRGKLSVKVLRNILHPHIICLYVFRTMMHFPGYSSCKRSAFLQIRDRQCLFRFDTSLENPSKIITAG